MNFENTNRRNRQLVAHRDYSSTANWHKKIPAILPTIFGIGRQKFLQYCKQYSEQADKNSCNIANNIQNRQTKIPAILPTIFGLGKKNSCNIANNIQNRQTKIPAILPTILRIGRQKFLQYCQQYLEYFVVLQNFYLPDYSLFTIIHGIPMNVLNGKLV